MNQKQFSDNLKLNDEMRKLYMKNYDNVNNKNNYEATNISFSNFQNQNQFQSSNNNFRNEELDNFSFNNRRNRRDFELNNNNYNDNKYDNNIPHGIRKFKKIPRETRNVNNTNQNEFQKRNLDINEFNRKIEKNLDYYKQKSKEIFSTNKKDEHLYNKGGNYNNNNFNLNNNNNTFINYNEINTSKFPFPKDNYNNKKINLMNSFNEQSSLLKGNNNLSNNQINNSSNLISHSKQIIVEIIEPGVSHFNMPEIENMKFITYNHKYKKIIKKFGFIVILSGIIMIFVYNLSKKEQKEEILNALRLISPNMILSLVVTVFIIFIILYFIMKKNDNDYYNDIAERDYKILEEMIKKRDNNFIGIFQNQFIKEYSEKRNIPESKYKKYILPILKKLIELNNKIIDAQVNISNQIQDIWKLKESI